MTNLVFLDTETTSLRHDRRAWEIGLIFRDQHVDAEHHWFVARDDLDLGNADPMSLKIGAFYDRHPDYAGRLETEPGSQREHDVLKRVEFITRGAHLVGTVVNFDADVLAARMRAHGICPSWHYHLCCVENLTAGWLQRHAAYLENRTADLYEATRMRDTARPPWDSHELSRAVGVNPEDFDRHTALGDARWARAIYDTVTGGAP